LRPGTAARTFTVLVATAVAILSPDYAIVQKYLGTCEELRALYTRSVASCSNVAAADAKKSLVKPLALPQLRFSSPL